MAVDGSQAARLKLRPATLALSALAVIAPLTVLWLLEGPEMEQAIRSFPLLALAGATLVHLLWLCARSEAWRLSLNAIELPVPRLGAHAASAAGYAAGTIQSASGLPVRAVSLNRLVSGSPGIDRTMVAEMPLMTIEAGLIATVFVVAVAVASPAPAWSAVAALGISLVAVAGLAWLAHRHPDHRATAGLQVLSDRSRRGPLLGVVGLMTALGLLRAWIVLAGAGLPHGPASVAVLFAALGLLGALPLGPGSSPGAMLAVFASVDAPAAAGAGLAMVGTSILAVTLYAALVGAVLGAQRRRRLAGVPVRGALPERAVAGR